MKTFKLLLVVALFAAAGVARGNTYNYDLDAPSSLASQEDVVVGEGEAVLEGARRMKFKTQTFAVADL